MKHKAPVVVLVVIVLIGGSLYISHKGVSPVAQDVVGRSSYVIPSLEGKSVFDSMSAYASSTSTFTFKAKPYDSLGYFIEGIGGRPNVGGYYWTLYINGKYSDKGASLTILKSGDIIEWKYEKK